MLQTTTMPRGYYLAQGLIPLGYSSSNDKEGPRKLPNSRIICSPHGLVVCRKYCTNYSAIDSDSDNNNNKDSDVEEDNNEESDKPPEDFLRCLDLGTKIIKRHRQDIPVQVYAV